MGIVSKNFLNASFVPNEKQVNAIKGFLIAYVDCGTFEGGHSGEDTPDLDWQWLFENIPAANDRVDELLNAGFLWQHQWMGWNEEGDYALGLTEDGVEWAHVNLGLPRPLFDEDGRELSPEAEAFINDLSFDRKTSRDVSAAAKGVKTTGEWVTQKSYTVAEAEAAIRRLIEAAEKGTIRQGSYRAYRAHVTRRTVRDGEAA